MGSQQVHWDDEYVPSSPDRAAAMQLAFDVAGRIGLLLPLGYWPVEGSKDSMRSSLVSVSMGMNPRAWRWR